MVPWPIVLLAGMFNPTRKPWILRLTYHCEISKIQLEISICKFCQISVFRFFEVLGSYLLFSTTRAVTRFWNSRWIAPHYFIKLYTRKTLPLVSNVQWCCIKEIGRTLTIFENCATVTKPLLPVFRQILWTFCNLSEDLGLL